MALLATACKLVSIPGRLPYLLWEHNNGRVFNLRDKLLRIINGNDTPKLFLTKIKHYH